LRLEGFIAFTAGNLLAQRLTTQALGSFNADALGFPQANTRPAQTQYVSTGKGQLFVDERTH
jgi:hypothetical protein